MFKDLGVKPALLPMPVLMVATYGEDGTVDVMNMAGGGVYDDDKVVLNLSPGHKTSANIRARRAFTLSVADVARVKEADYFGIASGNKVADKFARSGLTARKSSRVDAPIVEEFPITLECELIEAREEPETVHFIGRIVNTLAREDVLDESGKVDPSKVQALVFDPFRRDYYAIGEKVGGAWKSGMELTK